MSTDLINEDENLGFQLTRFAGKDGLMYQITQSGAHNSDAQKFVDYVYLSEENIELILERIKQSKY